MSNEISILARANRPVVALDACEHEGLSRGYARASLVSTERDALAAARTTVDGN
jgi:hypothetical protein